MNKRIVSLMVAAVLLCLCLTGCKNKAPEISTYTSEEQGVYYTVTGNGSKKVVDKDGKPMENYSVDEEGNIVTSGQIFITAANAKEFCYISSIISLNDTTSLDTTLTRQLKSGTVDEYENTPAIYEYKVYVSPANAMKPVVCASSSNTDIVELMASAGGGENPDHSVSYTANEGIASIYIKCKQEGTATIYVNAQDESNISFMFTVKVNEASGNDPDSDELPTDAENLIATTESTDGWVTGTNVRFRETPSTEGIVQGFFNTGKPLTILGSADGWTKCMIDNDIGYIKSEFVTRTEPTSGTVGGTQQGQNQTPTQTVVQNANASATPTPAPTATAAPQSNDGADHGLAYGATLENTLQQQDIAAHAENHTHYYTKYKVVKPTKTSRGYTIYRCECGMTYKTNYKEYSGNEEN